MSTAGAHSAAAVTLDAGWRILTWGRDAEEFFGYPAAAARGMVLHDVLKTRDLSGNPVACFCGMLQAIRLGEPVKPQVVEVTTASGTKLRVVTYLDPTTPSAPARGLVFQFRPDSRRRQADRRGIDLATSPGAGEVTWGPQRVRSASLSPAELKVLRLLAAGKRADEVAETLCNSVLTVRNHIQRILRKLGARSQAQAISVALRSGLV